MRVRASALAGMMAVALAACGGTTTKTVTTSASPSKTTTTHVAGTTPTGTTTTAAAAPLASRTGNVDNIPVTFSIVSLKRAGSTVQLTFSLTTKSSDRAQVGSAFDDGLFEKITSPGASTVSGADSLDGIYLIDSTNRKKYLVGRDSQNACICDSDLGNGFVGDSAPLFLSATFGAPPVSAVDVFVPHYGTFANVPIS